MEYAMSRSIVIRFDGLDATNELLDMRQFGQSLIGISRILKNSAHFAIRHEYAERYHKPHVQIMARPPKDGCVILEAIAIAATAFPLLQPLLENVTWELITTLTGAIFLRRSGRQREMERSLDTIDKLVEQQGIQNAGIRKDLVGIAHKLIDANQSAVREALYPVGKTCSSLQIGDTEAGAPIIDAATADAIRSKEDLQVQEAKLYQGNIDSITKHTKSCKIELHGDEGHYTSGKITDPDIINAENVYTRALNEDKPIEFTAQALITEDGTVKRLYISSAEIISGSR